ncbi:MAG: hypothetical protein KDE17_18960 [Rhodobacteraceae bacterium]|nr:hypothetical protein [Paracoccaceae bacterium]
MKIKALSVILAALSLAGCAETAVTPIAKNQILLSTSAAPACGRAGAVKVATKMAAVETLRRGYQRFVIAGANSANNTSAISTGPTYAYTSGTYTGYGNTVYGNSTTTFGGNNVMFVGSNDADLHVLMLNPGDRGFKDGIDAKSQLGPDWEKLVQDGISTCSD